MSRIIMNTLLLKYVGHLSLFGSEGNDKDDYLGVVRRCLKIFRGEDMEVGFEKQTFRFEFARYVLTKSKDRLNQM